MTINWEVIIWTCITVAVLMRIMFTTERWPCS